MEKDMDFFEFPLRELEYHQISQAGSMNEAVSVAAAIGSFGDNVLLSPGAASFDLFTSYKERGNLFNACVNEL